MAIRLRLLSLILVSLFYAGCASTPTLSKSQVFEEYEQISLIQSRLNEDKINDLFDLAPVGFAAAQSKLAEAIVLGQNRNDTGVVEKVAEGRHERFIVPLTRDNEKLAQKFEMVRGRA